MGLIIVCGFGPAGRSCVRKLERETGNIVVIDSNPEKLRNLAHTYVVGDATKEEVLLKAGIEKAEVLIATADSDIVNAFITLAAKSINPGLRVLTIAERLESVDKLYRAGADYVVPESSISARELVNGALEYTKEASRIYLGNDVELHAIKAKGTGAISHIERISGARIAAIKRGNVLLNPEKAKEYRNGDVLYVVGSGRQVELLRKGMREGL